MGFPSSKQSAQKPIETVAADWPCAVRQGQKTPSTCKLNDVDPRAWIADIPARIADHPAKRVGELLPWNWKIADLKAAA